MFRMQGLPQVDPAEERRKVRESVKTNIFVFFGLCAVIRLGKKKNSFHKYIF